MFKSQYQRLHQSFEDESADNASQENHSRGHSPWFYVFCLLLAVSLMLNAIGFSKFILQSQAAIHSAETAYAGLSYDTPMAWTRHDAWNSDNRTEENSAWNEPPGFNVREAIVALSDTFAASVDLPTAQRWPWDHSKGIYFLEGLHNLQCVRYLRKYVLKTYRVESPNPSISFRHLKHCLDGLRQFVMCNADDTPRYTGRLHDQADAEEPFGGIGQVHDMGH